jgi:long-chain acyl-CoA synthetase
MGTAVPFTTIHELFDRLTAHFAGETRPILLYKVEKEYRGIGYSELRRKVELFALGLASLGIQKDDRVALISENRPEWVIADLAVICLGAVGIPIYPTLTPKQIEFICIDGGVKSIILSNTLQRKKVLSIRDQIPALQHIISMADHSPAQEAPLVTFSKMYEMGLAFEQKNPQYFRDHLAGGSPDDLLTIIYTSGTTGTPKGVMLTHRNLVSNIHAAAEVLPISEQDTLLSFLPLCHTFERMAGYYTALACGATVAYAESIDTVRENLLEVHPTIVTTVPRLFERLYHGIHRQVKASPRPKQKVFHWAVRIGKQYARVRRHGKVDTFLWLQYSLAQKLVFSTLIEKTGGRMRYFVSGGAALPRNLGEFFEALGIIILEGYGLTETSPVLTVNRLDDYKYGTVGKPLPGVEIKIAEDGEILAKGPNIMKGYYRNAEATKEVITDDGWFHTGDVGTFDTEGHLVITDRKKHLFVSSGGKNIAPQPIENLFLRSKYIDQFVLIGDGRMFCTALVVPDFPSLKEFARDAGIPYSSDTDLVLREEVRRLYSDEIDQLQKNLPNFERVRRFELLPHPFDAESGEITPTQKIKRKVIEQRYAHVIDKMYQGISKS